MPPRKSDVSKSITDEGAAGATTPVQEGPSKEKESKEGKDGINIEDLNLPKSIVTRLAKGVLPPNTQIQANAILALQKSATVFINYLATHANAHTQEVHRKTITPADVIKALEDIEFEGFQERIEAELEKFTAMQTDKRNNYRKKLADKATGGKGSASTEITEAGETAEGNGDGPPAAKKAKVDESWQNREEDPMDDIADETLDEHLDQDMEEEQEEEDADQEEEEGEGEEEPPEEREEEEREEDEALDNGEDSD